MIIVILNGFPGSGKDEFINVAGEEYKCHHHSTIEACKDICWNLYWDGEKDDKSRRMLSELKKWYIEYFDGVFKDFVADVKWAGNVNRPDFFFVVSREGEEINRIKEWCKENDHKCVYVFMDRGTERNFGNESDDNVLENATPNIYFGNNGDIDKLREDCLNVLNGIISDV